MFSGTRNSKISNKIVDFEKQIHYCMTLSISGYPLHIGYNTSSYSVIATRLFLSRDRSIPCLLFAVNQIPNN